MAYKKSDATRSRIVLEAKALFYENGYEKTTMRQIAKACEINQSLLYYYYLNKNALATEILDDYWEKMEVVLTEYLEYEQFPMLFLLAIVRLIDKELEKDQKEVDFYCQIFNETTCDRPFMNRMHEAICLYTNDPNADIQKSKISLTIGDKVWSGLVAEKVAGRIDISLAEILNISDSERYMYLGISTKAISNLISIAEGIVARIPISGIKIVEKL